MNSFDFQTYFLPFFLSTFLILKFVPIQIGPRFLSTEYWTEVVWFPMLDNILERSQHSKFSSSVVIAGVLVLSCYEDLGVLGQQQLLRCWVFFLRMFSRLGSELVLGWLILLNLWSRYLIWYYVLNFLCFRSQAVLSVCSVGISLTSCWLRTLKDWSSSEWFLESTYLINFDW